MFAAPARSLRQNRGARLGEFAFGIQWVISHYLHLPASDVVIDTLSLVFSNQTFRCLNIIITAVRRPKDNTTRTTLKSASLPARRIIFPCRKPRKTDRLFHAGTAFPRRLGVRRTRDCRRPALHLPEAFERAGAKHLQFTGH